MPTTEEDRRTLLQQTIDSYIARGYRVVSREQWSATLGKRETFITLLARVLHLPGHAAGKAGIVTIAITPDGRIHAAAGGVHVPRIEATEAPLSRSTQPLASPAPIVPDDAVIAGRYEILCTSHEGGSISHVGIRDTAGLLRRLSKREGIVSGRLELFVARNGITANVIVTGPPGREFLKTEADGTSGNNLSSLPDCGRVPPELDGPAGRSSTCTLPRRPHLIVGATTPYYTLLDASQQPEVYHDRTDCPDGRRIEEEKRIPGTGGRDKCRECRKLEEAGLLEL